MASRRKERVSRLLKETISQVIQREISDPRLGFVTITYVDPSPDLKSAKVYVSVLGEDGVISRTMKSLVHSAGFIRRSIGGSISLRSVPRLDFVLDESGKRSVEISRIIAEAVGETSDEDTGDGDQFGKEQEES